MITYKLVKNINGVVCSISCSNGLSIPADSANTDFVEYQKWLSEGNVPLPPDEPTLP